MLSTCTLQIRCGNAEIPRKVGKTTRPMPLFWNSLPVDLFARYHSDINQIGESSQHIGSLIMDIDASSTGVSSGTRIQNSFPLNRSTIIVESLNRSHKPSYPPGLDLPQEKDVGTTQEPRYPPGLRLPQTDRRPQGQGAAL